MRIFGVLVLLLIAAAIGQNAYTYFNYGGLKGGWLSTVLAGFLHLTGIGLCIYLSLNIKSIIKKD